MNEDKIEQLKDVHFFMQEVLRKCPLDFFGFTFNTGQYDFFLIKRERERDLKNIETLKMTCKAHGKTCQIKDQNELIRIIINRKD